MTKADLSAMTLSELMALREALGGLQAAGSALEANLMVPVFDLTPGREITIFTDLRMPGVARADLTQDDAGEIGLAPAAAEALRTITPLPDAAGSAPVEAAPAPGDDGAGEVPPGDDDYEPAGADSEDAATPPKGVPYAYVPAVHAQPEPAAPPPGSARAMAAEGLWSEGEDARAVFIYVDQLCAGATKAAACRVVAQNLGRPEQGTAFRLKTKLLARVQSLLAARATPSAPAQGCPPAEAGAGPENATEAGAASPQGEAKVAEDPGAMAARAGAPDPAPEADLLGAHLAGVPRKGPWTVEADQQLMEFAGLGWHVAEIAMEMQIESAAVKARFEVLTDAKRFPRADVLARLTAMMMKGAA